VRKGRFADLCQLQLRLDLSYNIPKHVFHVKLGKAQYVIFYGVATYGLHDLYSSAVKSFKKCKTKILQHCGLYR